MEPMKSSRTGAPIAAGAIGTGALRSIAQLAVPDG